MHSFVFVWHFTLLNHCKQEYKEILEKRIQQLDLNRKRPDQLTVLVRGIPLCTEHGEHGCCVDHFFSKHYHSAYYAYQIAHDRRNIEQLMVATLLNQLIVDLFFQNYMRNAKKMSFPEYYI
jgi:calcium permeable stress-gated cation channel